MIGVVCSMDSSAKVGSMMSWGWTDDSTAKISCRVTSRALVGTSVGSLNVRREMTSKFSGTETRRSTRARPDTVSEYRGFCTGKPREPYVGVSDTVGRVCRIVGESSGRSSVRARRRVGRSAWDA